MTVQISKLADHSITRVPRSYKEATQGRHLRREDFDVDNDLSWGMILAGAIAALTACYLAVVL